MSTVTVRTQEEYDTAIAEGADTIFIDSPQDVSLRVADSSRVEASGSSHVVAWDSSRVVARDSSHVEARDSSRVVAWDSSRVVARDSSHVVALGSSRVEAWGSSHVEAWDSSRVVARDSSHVEASDSSRVEAWDSSHVEASGSSHVVAWDSSRVVARDSSHVEASDSSRVEARDSSRVEARDSSHVVARGYSRVEAGRFVAVHLHSSGVDLTGGVVIDMTSVDYTDAETWLASCGAKVSHDGFVTVYKGTDSEGKSAHGFTYVVGESVSDEHWTDDNECGGGLHFCPTPSATLSYIDAERFFRCRVRVDELRAISQDKLKAPRAWVDAEVDIRGNIITPTGGKQQ